MNKAELTIDVQVKQVIWPKPDADEGGLSYRIFSSDRGVCKGQIAWRPASKERLKLRANGNGKDGWVMSSYDGKPEFIFASASHDIPTDERAILSYVCELTKGIGPVMEACIWQVRGDDWRNISEGEVKGLTSSILLDFQTVINEIALKKERTEAIAYLRNLGCTLRMAEVAWERWGIATISKVEHDCYSLAELPNYSFADVDKRIAARYNIGRDDHRRIFACINYCTRQLSASNTLFSWVELRDKIYRAIDSSPNAITLCVKAMFGDGRLVPFQDMQPQSIATHHAWLAEKCIADYINK